MQLLCTHHKRFPKESACEVAESAVKQNFGAQAIIGYGDASEYSQPLPMNLGKAHFIAPCGCRAWPLPFYILLTVPLLAVAVSLDFSKPSKGQKC